MRLDTELVKRELYKSRSRAVRAIEEGLVTVNGTVITKPSFEVSEKDVIEAGEDPVPYVGRGAFKLKHAISHFNIDLKGKICCDIGASTGGFTQIMLENGAEKVYAVDVGRGQLARELSEDPRVISLEGTDIRTLVNEGFYREYFDFASADVSFISLEKIIPFVFPLMKKDACMVCLVKPQFEAGPKALGKKGVIRDPAVHKKVLEDFNRYAGALFKVEEIIRSPIQGGDGNTEFLALLKMP